MREVTKKIKQAFKQGTSLKIGNTRTDGTSVFLHGNEIIRRDVSGLIFATLAGWNTTTTRERVNGITDMSFHQVNFEPCLESQPISSTDWFVKCHDGTKQALQPSPLTI
jgi:hypothetical protein